MTPSDPNELFDIPDPYAGTKAAPPSLVPTSGSPTRGEIVRRRRISLVLALVVEVALVAMMGLRDPATLTPALIAAAVFVPGVGAALALLTSSSRMSFGHRALFAAGLGVPLCLLLATGPGDSSAGGMLVCAVGGVMMALVPAMLALFAFRRGFASGARWRSVGLGLSVALVAALAMRLRCPNDAVLHLALGHGAPIALVVTLFAVVGVRLTRA